MNIVLCIKQVPDVDDIKWTKENNLDRSLMLSKINKYDDWALDWAIKIKNQNKDVKITAVSMGPKGAVRELEYALAKGADRAILLCDKAFAASDTLATSKIISNAIKKYVSDFDLILTGQMALDGDTAQVPVSLAQLLNIFDVTNAVDILDIDENQIKVKQSLEDETTIYKSKFPLLVAIKKECDEKYIPKIDDYIKAQNIKIEEYCFENLDLSKEQTGILGSPTYVHRAFRPEINKKSLEIREDYSSEILKIIKENVK